MPSPITYQIDTALLLGPRAMVSKRLPAQLMKRIKYVAKVLDTDETRVMELALAAFVTDARGMGKRIANALAADRQTSST